MEAWRFGFSGEPPAHKYDPTDEDIVAHYLLPRATGVPNPHAHAVVDPAAGDADPCSCPPWELLRRHGHAHSDHAFFFLSSPSPSPDSNQTRVCRQVRPAAPGGVGGWWRGQKGVESELVLVRGSGGGDNGVDGGGGGEEEEMTVRFRRYNLTYYRDDGEGRSSGWVMHEYHVLSPERLASGGGAAAVARVKITDAAKKTGVREKQMREEEEDVIARASWARARAPGPDQPGPSSNYCFVSKSDNYHDGHATAAVASVAGEGTSGGGGRGYYTDFLNAVVSGGVNYDDMVGDDSFLDGDRYDGGNAVAKLSGGGGGGGGAGASGGHAQSSTGSEEMVHQEGGVDAGDYYFDDGSYYVDDGNVYYSGEDVSQYLNLNPDVFSCSTGDCFATTEENKGIYEPPVSDTPAAITATEDEDNKKEDKG